jgi:hypothetical protein
MNIPQRYHLRVKSPNGQLVAVLDDFVRLDYEHRLNDAGQLTLTLRGDDPRVELINLDGIIEVWRTGDDISGTLWAVEFETLPRNFAYATDEKGVTTYTATCVGLNDLLARRVIAYKEGTVRAEKSAPAETCMKAYVRENCGDLASTETAVGRVVNGVMEGFSVEADGAHGATWNGARAFENLLDVIKEISAFAQIDFQVVSLGGGLFEFRTYPNQLGQDRTIIGLDPATGLNGAGNPPVVIDLNFGNAARMSYAFNRSNEINTVVVLGQGERSTRTVLVRQDALTILASPWNQREAVRSTNQEFTYQLETFGDEQLLELSAKEELTFDPLEVPNTRYGTHFVLGDKITLRYRFVERHRRIVAVKNTVVAGSSRQVTLELANL